MTTTTTSHGGACSAKSCPGGKNSCYQHIPGQPRGACSATHPPTLCKCGAFIDHICDVYSKSTREAGYGCEECDAMLYVEIDLESDCVIQWWWEDE